MSGEVRILGPCPDCGAAPGQLHVPGCDQEPCPRCGEQIIGCTCVYELAGLDPERLETDHPEIYRGGPTQEMEAAWDATWGPRRIRWPGEPHGAAECREYGFWALPTPAGPVPMPAGTPGVEEDFESMFQACQWDPRAQRFAPMSPGRRTIASRLEGRATSKTSGHVNVGKASIWHDRPDDGSIEDRVGIAFTDEQTKERVDCGRLIRRRSCDGYQLMLARGDRGDWWVLMTREDDRDTIWICYAPEGDDRRRAWCEEHATRCFERATRIELELVFSLPSLGRDVT